MIAMDYKNPDYKPIFLERLQKLKKIRENPKCLPALFGYYKNNIAQFITDWGCTVDPRNPALNLPAVIPFILFDKQVEWVDWAVGLFLNNKNGLCDKSREMGVTWLAVAVAVSLCIFREGLKIGFGSRKESEVDCVGSAEPIFGKIRSFLDYLPKEFRGGYEEKSHSKHKLIKIPATNCEIIGESGDNQGRSRRYSLVFSDEAAFFPHPKTTDKSLSEATKCRIEISTPNGTANSFYEKRMDPTTNVITMHWRDDPRKDLDWYNSRVETLRDPVLIAQELDISYTASIEDSILKIDDINNAIDAHKKLKITATGHRVIGYDPADKGADKNAMALRYGFLLESVEDWSGFGSDMFASVLKVYNKAVFSDCRKVIYDGDGLGAGVRGDQRKIESEMKKGIQFISFNSAASVLSPESSDTFTRKNKDFFANRKAQAWWALRAKLIYTSRAVRGELGEPISENKLIAIDGNMKNLSQLVAELCQPQFKCGDTTGKVLVEKRPDGAKSPNLADAFMMCYCGGGKEIFIPKL